MTNWAMSVEKRITVLMSVYNGDTFLRQAIESILNQTYRNFDFVIYDDCSTDATAEIIKSYDDARIIYRRNEQNQGLTKNLADGVARSETEYIVRMDADDIAYPQRLQRQQEWMDNHLEISISGTSVSYFHEIPGDSGDALQPEDDATIKALLFSSFTLMHPSIIIRSADLKRNGLNYDPNFRYSQDHALYLNCIRAGLKFGNIQEPLLYMRAHNGSISRALHGPQQECSQRARHNFIMATSIAQCCSKEEISAYNSFASGVFPDTIEKVRAYERFVFKVCANPFTAKYFDVNVLQRSLSEKLVRGSYHVMGKKGLKRVALRARRSKLKSYCERWSCKLCFKFYLKFLFK